MKKSIFTDEFAAFLRTLRAARKKAGLTQVELAERVGKSQSEVSKWERGETRLDIVQVRAICLALGTTLPAFVRSFEKRLSK